MRKTLSILLSVSSVIAFAMPAGALSAKYVTRTNGTAAVAEWQSQNGDIMTDNYISANVTKSGTDVFVSLCNINTNTWEYVCQSGYTFTTENIFTVDKLNKATLAPVKIDLYDDSWNPSGSVTVQASWTGTGKTTKGSFRTKSSYDGYNETFSNQSSERQATATGSFDGSSLGTSSYGYLVQFKSADMVRIK